MSEWLLHLITAAIAALAFRAVFQCFHPRSWISTAVDIVVLTICGICDAPFGVATVCLFVCSLIVGRMFPARKACLCCGIAGMECIHCGKCVCSCGCGKVYSGESITIPFPCHSIDITCPTCGEAMNYEDRDGRFCKPCRDAAKPPADDEVPF